MVRLAESKLEFLSASFEELFCQFKAYITIKPGNMLLSLFIKTNYVNILLTKIKPVLDCRFFGTIAPSPSHRGQVEPLFINHHFRHYRKLKQP